MTCCYGLPNIESLKASQYPAWDLICLDTCLRQLLKWNLYMSNMYEITMLIYEQHI